MRPEAVEAVVQAEFVRISPAQRELVARATPAEREVAALAIAHAREAKRLLEEMGLMRAPTVLDLTRADVDRLGKRADAARRAMYELDVTGVWREDMTLGQALKVARRESARAAIRILRAGGYREVDDLAAE